MNQGRERTLSLQVDQRRFRRRIQGRVAPQLFNQLAAVDSRGIAGGRGCRDVGFGFRSRGGVLDQQGLKSSDEDRVVALRFRASGCQGIGQPPDQIDGVQDCRIRPRKPQVPLIV